RRGERTSPSGGDWDGGRGEAGGGPRGRGSGLSRDGAGDYLRAATGLPPPAQRTMFSARRAIGEASTRRRTESISGWEPTLQRPTCATAISPAPRRRTSKTGARAGSMSEVQRGPKVSWPV